MDFDRLMDDCATLEKTISGLIKSNSCKQSELRQLQSDILASCEFELGEVVNRESELKTELESLKYKKEDLDAKVKQYANINEKLQEVVATAQQTSNRHNELSLPDKYNETYVIVSESIQDFEQLNQEYIRLCGEIVNLETSLQEAMNQMKAVVADNKELVINLHKNDDIIRLLFQQNKFSEQQFDIILSQLPWEPLPEQYMEELQNSSNETIRQLATVFQLQTSEINDLNESLRQKKLKKLEILEQLSKQLDCFVRKREAAILMGKSQIPTAE